MSDPDKPESPTKYKDQIEGATRIKVTRVTDWGPLVNQDDFKRFGLSPAIKDGVLILTSDEPLNEHNADGADYLLGFLKRRNSRMEVIAT